MAATLGELKSDVANWLARADLTAMVPSLVSAGLARINNELALAGGIPHQDNSVRYQNLGGGDRWDNYYIATDPTRDGPITMVALDDSPLLEMEYNRMVDHYGTTEVASMGKPEVYAVNGDTEIHLRPIPDRVYIITVAYRSMRIPMPSTDTGPNSTNRILTHAGNLWLYASLLEAEGLLQNDPRIATWAQQYQRAFDVFVKSQQMTRRTALQAPLVVDPALRLNGGAFSITSG